MPPKPSFGEMSLSSSPSLSSGAPGSSVSQGEKRPTLSQMMADANRVQNSIHSTESEKTLGGLASISMGAMRDVHRGMGAINRNVDNVAALSLASASLIILDRQVKNSGKPETEAQSAEFAELEKQIGRYANPVAKIVDNYQAREQRRLKAADAKKQLQLTESSASGKRGEK